MNTTTNTRGVSEAMVALDRALEAVNAPLITDKANERAAWEAVSVLQSHGATLRAALSAEPAAQGEGLCWRNPAPNAAPAVGMTSTQHIVYLSPEGSAPPVQPAERVPEDGVSRIAAERQRQKEVEGWTPEHDASHGNATLTKAAICYATFAASAPFVRDDVRRLIPRDWPWGSAWWKPGADNSNASRVRELVKAGALIAAEIDRLAATPAAPAEEGDGKEVSRG